MSISRFDMQEFVKGICNYYHKAHSDSETQLFWDDLKAYSKKELDHAFTQHRLHRRDGKWMPTVAHLLNYLQERSSSARFLPKCASCTRTGEYYCGPSSHSYYLCHACYEKNRKRSELQQMIEDKIASYAGNFVAPVPKYKEKSVGSFLSAIPAVTVSLPKPDDLFE
jgi:hypothetical protein